MGKWSGLNKISHPHWAKICDDHNGQISLCSKQKYEVLSATRYIELRHDSLCPLVRFCVTKLSAPIADQLQHCSIKSMNDSLLGLTSTLETTLIQPRLNPSTAQPGYQSSSCLYHQRLFHQLSLPSTTIPPAVSTVNDYSTSCLYRQRLFHQLSLPSTTIPPAVSTINDYSTSCLYHQRLFHQLSLPSTTILPAVSTVNDYSTSWRAFTIFMLSGKMVWAE